ncbi:unnamed protein product, partial [marine sediment metagenome]
IESQFNISLYLDRMSDCERKKFNEMWRRAKPKHYDDLTEAEQKAYDKSQAELYREAEQARPYNEMRELLQIGINIKSDAPDSELFRTAKELLDMLDRAETEPSSFSTDEKRKLRTRLYQYKALLKAELKKNARKGKKLSGKPAGTGQKEIVEVKPGAFGITVNIKEIAKRIWKCVCSRSKD